MKLILNPAYESLRGYLMNIDFHFAEGALIHQGRNSIRLCQIEGQPLVIKQYAIPSLPNRMAYTFLRSPKGLRAFLYPQRLIQAGFESPEPVAYIEKRKFGLLERSYFISTPCPYTRRFYEFGNADVRNCKDILTAFARYTARLHQAGIMHLDYSPGNILFGQVGSEWHFSLVDTNRMYFGPVSVRKGCRNMARLWGQPAMFHLLARQYALAREADIAQCEEWVMRAREQFWRRFSKRHPIKYDLKY